jgi:hypothetical protein
MCSHCYVVFPPFEVAEDDEDKGALRYTGRMSSGHDLVEEFIGYGVWPLAHGWVLGEVCPRRMPSLGDQLVRSPAFALDLRGRNLAAFVQEVEADAVRIVGRYVPRTETLRSWDIRVSNIRLNRVFELNCLPYGGVMMFDARTGRGLVGEFFFGVWISDKIMMQVRMLGNWLLSQRRWRSRRSR